MSQRDLGEEGEVTTTIMGGAERLGKYQTRRSWINVGFLVFQEGGKLCALQSRHSVALIWNIKLFLCEFSCCTAETEEATDEVCCY